MTTPFSLCTGPIQNIFPLPRRSAYALDNADADPAAGIARLEAVMDSSHPYSRYLLAKESPWLDDLYALLMYLWNRLGDTDRVLEYYARLAEVKEQNLVCRFCVPVNVIGADMPLAELEALVRSDDSRIKGAACNSPYLLDLLGLRQLASGYYDDARATFQQLRDLCGSAYPNLEPNDYSRVTSALQSIADEPSKANYQAYFALMDRSWTWNGEGDIPGSVTWFLQASVARTNAWSADVFVEANPWVMYAKKLEEYEAAFAPDAQTDVRIPAALLQAAWVYDVLSGYPNEALDKPSRDEFIRQLRGMAAENLRTYLQKYWSRTDIPPEFCRYYRPTASRLPTYNATQDCVMEWLALIHIGGNQEVPVARRLEETRCRCDAG